MKMARTMSDTDIARAVKQHLLNAFQMVAAQLASDLSGKPLATRALHSTAVEPIHSPALLTRAELAQHLRVLPARVDQLRRDGMPTSYIGKSPRFDLAACRGWIADKAAPVSSVRPICNPEEPIPGIRRVPERRPRKAN